MEQNTEISSKQTLEELIQQRKQIDQKISKLVGISYKKYGMSDIVKDDNPYSRLMALKKMGIVENYQDIRQKSVIVIGVGGIGSVTCEMLTRCGIGKLIIYDYDRVQLANMNRLFFTPSQVGMSKVEAAKQTLSLVNPDITIQAYNMNITTQEGYEHLVDRVLKGNLKEGKIDLLLSCVDNYGARMTVNAICNKNNQIWFESGVSETALSGHIQVIVPGQTGCFSCAIPLTASEGTQGTIKRQGVCAASLPTTMGIIAGLLSQASLKYLLQFGSLSHCLSYNAQTDFFNSYPIALNPECKEPSCQQNQKRKKENKLEKLIEKVQPKKKIVQQQLKKVNQWGIKTIQQGNKEEFMQKNVKVGQDQTLEDLMTQFNKI